MSVRSAKSSWTSCARTRSGIALLLAAVLAATLAAPALAKKGKGEKKKERPTEELFNPLLGIDYSHWLVGPLAAVASDEEIDRYLALTSDEAAAEFIEAFWTRRAEGVGIFEKKPRQVYDERVVEADKRFSEGAFPGSRTDRGKIFILYGEPEDVAFETPRDVEVPTLEVWHYPPDAPPGLDGETPKKAFRFVQIDGSKVLYEGQRLRLTPIERERLRRGGDGSF